MTLMIVAHPNLAASNANKTIMTSLQQRHPDMEVRSLQALYPDQNIDVAAEQAALLRHELIILQFPLYWYHTPAVLKAWFDQVLTYGFAYGSQGTYLKNKTLLVSVTVGQPEQNYIEHNRPFMPELLRPLQKSAEYVQMHYLEPICLYDIATVLGHSNAQIQTRAAAHSEVIHQAILAHQTTLS